MLCFTYKYVTRSEKMSFKFSFKSIEIGGLSQFERKAIPNGWRCDAERALRCNRLSSWYLKGHPVARSQRSTWQIVVVI